MLFAVAIHAAVPADQETWRLLAQRLEMVGTQQFVAEGEAEAVWGSRRIRAQRIAGDLDTGWITATGGVLYTDQQTTLRATEARFNLKTREGDLHEAQGEMSGLFVSAESLHSDGRMLTMRKVTLTPCDREPAEVLLSADSISVSPALRLQAREVSLSLWGRKWVTLPYLSRRIGRREPGEPFFPQLGYSRQRGVMLYYGELLPQRWGQMRYGLRLFTRHDPELRIDLLRRLDDEGDQEPLRPLDPTERPGVSFLETVGTRDWRAAVDTVNKRGVFLSLKANTPVENLRRTDLYLRGGELGYQTVASWAGGVVETEWKLGRLRESPTLATANRAVSIVRWQSPVIQLAGNTGADLLLDARVGVYTGARAYGWTRVQWGVYYGSQEDRLRAGAGLSLAVTSGRSPFAFDQLETRREARFRVQLRGRWGVDVLGMWDIEHQRWRDWQVVLSPPAHCIQPLLLWSYQQRQLQIQLSLVSR
jgi:hypothetical protein